VGFGEAVSTVLKQYAEFSGRARRSEYWWYYLFFLIVYGVSFGIGVGVKAVWLPIIVILALVLPTLAVGVRRLHDTGRSGWFTLIGIIPIVGPIVLIVFFCQDGNPGDNQYGPSPKAALYGR